MAGTSYITDSTPASDMESVSVSTVAVGPASSKLTINQAGGFMKRCVKMFITVESNTILIRWDGGTAGAGAGGHKLTSGSSITIEGERNCSNVSMIRDTADATVKITYYYNR